MLLLNLIPLIDVTFSTPTPGYNNKPLQRQTNRAALWKYSVANGNVLTMEVRQLGTSPYSGSPILRSICV